MNMARNSGRSADRSFLSADLLKRFTWSENISHNLDARLKKSLNRWQTGSVPDIYRISSYNQLDFERLLSDVSRLLDQCLIYRREYLDLQASAIRQVLEYSLYESQRDTLKKIEKASWGVRTRILEAEGQKHTASEFLKDGPSALAFGFSAAAKTSEDLSRQSALDEEERGLLVEEKWKQMDAYQERLQERHGESGSPLNYEERSQRVYTLLESDLFEAVTKSQVSADGIEKVFGIKRGPIWDDEKPLDSFVSWAREKISAYQLATYRDIRTERISELQMVNRKAGIKFIGFKKTERLRAVALSIRLKDTQDITNPSFVTAKLFVRTPSGILIELQPVGLMQAGVIPLYYSESNIWNVPINGEWQITLAEVFNSFGHVEAKDVDYVYLHLRCLVRP